MELNGVWLLVIGTVAAALVFDAINGFHDAANSIATVVSTRVLSPRTAVLWAAFFNFVAMFVFAPKVADTISKIVHIQQGDPVYVEVVLAGLVGAIAWDLQLGVAPLPESEARYRELLGQSARPAAPPPSTRIGDIPFIGREKEITLLNLGWQAAREGAGRIVIVCGVAGLGKSRLLSEFVAGLEDAHVLEAACYPSTQGLPFYPWIEALRPTMEDQPPDIVREPWRNDLLGLLPLQW